MKKITPLLLFTLIFIGLGLAVGIQLAYKRIVFEQRMRQIDTAITLKDVQKLAYGEGISLHDCLIQLKKTKAISSIVVDEDTLGDLVEKGQLTVLHGSELINAQRVGLDIPLKHIKIEEKATYLLTDSDALRTRLYGFLSASFPLNTQQTAVQLLENLTVIQVLADPEVLKEMGIGTSEATLKGLEKLGFSLIIRLKNNSALSQDLIKKKFDVFSQTTSRLVIFEGTQVLGYPNALTPVRKEIHDRHLFAGIIEFADQFGARNLAGSLPESAFRVHSIAEAEIASKYTPQTAISRFVRAAKERNMRLLIVHPFLVAQNTQSLLTFNLEYFTHLSASLHGAGLDVAPSQFQSIPYPSASAWQLLIISMGALSLGLWLCGATQFWILLMGPWLLFFIVSLLLGRLGSFSLVTAWLIAVGFPTLTILTQTQSGETILAGIRYLAKLIFPCILGGIWISGLLSQKSYWLGITSFSGIKLAFLIPLLIIAIRLLSKAQKQTPRQVITTFLKTPITVGLALAGCLVLGLIAIYLLRSGNSGLILGFESKARNSLESLFWIRPRTKEFLLGIPLLTFAYFSAKDPKLTPYQPYLLSAGAIGLVSLMNTFCHIHTPLLISIYRSLLGGILGFCIGLIGVGLYHFSQRNRA